ncbi:PEP-CTERM sorting domain-containing protein [Aliiglaciecola sp. LCG003]|uniref:PEP-CTERM sorting domain-containing protein n=1 Tax=Aliiglaciecola sp. LCG003 TaxID=3053655 RepID=UPI0025730EAE|nr:PEP-CTERM sorting domain-containing protein [Aliiglaciecola sp. LCG003]WJG08398.1 PEP-CTERM sorting domain-containing protein [Aliiglaciecola sp. LCG003]
MKYLNKVLLATGLIVSTLGMSMTASAGAIIKQDIYVSVDFADSNPYGIVEGANQLIGSITYNTDDADDFGFLSAESTVLDLSPGTLSLGLSDAVSAEFSPQLLTAGIDMFNPFAGLDFFVDEFNLFGASPDYVLALELSAFGGFMVLDEIFYDVNGDIEDVFPVAFAETNLGAVTYVPEPSALLLMLAGLGLLVRRKVSAK